MTVSNETETREVLNDEKLAEAMVYEVAKITDTEFTDGEARAARATLRGMLRAQRNQTDAKDEADRVAAQFTCERFNGMSIQQWLKALAAERKGTAEAVNLLRVAYALDDYGVVVPPIDFGKAIAGEPQGDLLYRLRATKGCVFIEGGLLTEAAARIEQLAAKVAAADKLQSAAGSTVSHLEGLTDDSDEEIRQRLADAADQYAAVGLP